MIWSLVGQVTFKLIQRVLKKFCRTETPRIYLVCFIGDYSLMKLPNYFQICKLNFQNNTSSYHYKYILFSCCSLWFFLTTLRIGINLVRSIQNTYAKIFLNRLEANCNVNVWTVFYIKDIISVFFGIIKSTKLPKLLIIFFKLLLCYLSWYDFIINFSLFRVIFHILLLEC